MAGTDVLSRVLARVFGSRNERLLRRYNRIVDAAGAYEAELRGDFDERFAARAEEVRASGLEGEDLEKALQAVRVELSADLRQRTEDLRGRIAPLVRPFDEWWRALSQEQRYELTFHKRYHARDQEFIDALWRAGILAEAFAVLREASRRAQAHRHFDCQLVGGWVLFEGKIAEMKTGEGKTIVCHLPCYVKVLAGRKVHVVTVNDYLVKRDALFARPIFELVGMTVGYIQSGEDPGGSEGLRRQAYACDITYGTNNEFGFDYLRDNMKVRVEDQVQGRLEYAIIDEVDSILIDEARTPLIISGPAHDDVSRYRWADDIARVLVRKQEEANRETAARLREWGDHPPEGLAANPKFVEAVKRFRVDPSMLTEDEAEAIGHRQYFVVQRDRKQVHLTHEGVAAAQEAAGIGSFYVGANMDRPHLIENALRAHIVYERDRDYVVQNREVIIVDEFTGRLMYGRQWSEGLHQAVEAKEGVPIKEETQTLATITLQNFFRLYDRIAGMTGTALTETGIESQELLKIYLLDVVAVPTNRPVNRVDHNDRVYPSIANKFDAIVEEIHDMHARGRPVDPYLLYDLLRGLREVAQRLGQETGRIEEALSLCRQARDGQDEEALNRVVEIFDETVGDLYHGRPILVGTTSVENSEKLSNVLTRRYGIEHEVLNAKYHEREAEIVAKAGQLHEVRRGGRVERRGNVTIATNMAGRGTDIRLGSGVVYARCVGDLGPGDPEQIDPRRSAWHEPGVIGTKCCVRCPDYNAATGCAHCWKPKVDPRFPELGRRVCALSPPCGLHIVGTERHESRRIDNQLRGRAGRQGDPGSSRFFLSLEDDLLKLFMPDWMLKMMERMGFTGGVSLEDRRLTKGIERAQKKVEERNANIRKHLLEWDEPMDFQRKQFYLQRQRVLEGENLDTIVWNLIEEAVAEGVGRYLSEDYNAQRIADWVRVHLDLQIDPGRLDLDSFEQIEQLIRSRAFDEALESIRTTLGEYVDPEVPPREWDVTGLQAWAQRSFNYSITQNRVRRCTPEEIEEELIEAARRHIEEFDLRPIELLMDPTLGRRELIDWVRNKFGLEVAWEEIASEEAEKVQRIVLEKVREAYRRREIEYPIEAALDRTLRLAGEDSAYAAQQLVDWVNGKFRAGWTLEDVQGKSVEQLFSEIRALHEDFVARGALEKEVDEALGRLSRDALREWARQRFGPAFDGKQFDSAGEDLRGVLLRFGRVMLRWELQKLEQFVLLRVYDQAWKDHLLEMDHLKHAIMQRPLGGDQTHPQSQYAIEGRQLFDAMWDTVRERVTDTILKVRLTTEPAAALTVYRDLQTVHQEVETTGVRAAAYATADQAAAMRAQGQPAGRVQTIRRTRPKIGRNAPCPCGSGKKYKHCCGRN